MNRSLRGSMKMVKFTIDGSEVEVPARSTILDGPRQRGIVIPTLCSMKGRRPQTSCMVCLVKVEGEGSLVPACAFEAKDGMKVTSDDPAVLEARRTSLELLLGEHGGDCLGPCRIACPARIDVPLVIRLIRNGEIRGAVEAVKEKVPFPAVLGRICPAPCEKGCRRAAGDSAVSIRELERFAGDAALDSPESVTPPAGPQRSERVAVVGAGPAGMTAAWFLRRDGFACTVFEKSDRPGGMLRQGVPEDILPRSVLDREVRAIEEIGVEFRMGCRLGDSISLEQLRGDFDAVLIATGSPADERTDRSLLVPGQDEPLSVNRKTFETGLPGVYAAGALLRPGKLAVRAMAQGGWAARSIAIHLEGKEVEERQRPFSTHLGKLDQEEMAGFLAGASTENRVTPQLGEAGGFNGEEARREALRCLKCDCSGLSKCRLRQWAIELGARTGGYHGQRRRSRIVRASSGLVFDPGKCILCGLCIQITGDAAGLDGLAYAGRGFDVTVAAPFNRSLDECLARTASECVAACPTGALVFEERARE